MAKIQASELISKTNQRSAIFAAAFFLIAFGMVEPNSRQTTAAVWPQVHPSRSKVDSTEIRSTVFRGSSPGLAPSTMPVRFQADNVRWKAELIGRGASTPIVVGDRIFLTAYSGFGESAKTPGKLEDLKHHLLCFDAKTGKQIWQRDIRGNSAIPTRLSENLMGHGFASSTPVSDGESVFAFFGISGVFAFDLDGNFKWQNDVGWKDDNFGSSASMTVVGDRLIVNASIESDTVYAFDTATGRGLWKLDDVFRSWSMPVAGTSADGRSELVIVQKDIVRGVDPSTGVELWTCEGIHDYVVPSPVVDQGVVYINGGKESRTVAIKLGGTGDVTKTHRLWEARYGANVGSPVVHQGLVFNVLENGIVQCYRASDGTVLKRERIKGAGVVHASPTVVVGAKANNSKAMLLVPLPDNGIAVLEADAGLKFVGYNQFNTDGAPIKSSLAISSNEWVIRSDKNLFCISAGKTETVEHSYSGKNANPDLVLSQDKFDFDADTKRIKVYNRCLEFEPDKLVTFILASYEAVLTTEQKTKFREYVLENKEVFQRLRIRRQQLLWQHLTLPAEMRSQSTLASSMAQLETEAMATQREIRNVIKKQFTPEQLAEHLNPTEKR